MRIKIPRDMGTAFLGALLARLRMDTQFGRASSEFGPPQHTFVPWPPSLQFSPTSRRSLYRTARVGRSATRAFSR